MSHLHLYIEYIPLINNIPHFYRYSGLGCEGNGGFKFTVTDITEASLYRYMFKYSSILLQIGSKHEIILSFDDKATAEGVLERIQEDCPYSLDKLREELPKYQEMWINGWMSNFDYLLFLNKLANRSFNDVSQYPVMPWVLKQYSTSELDF